MNNEEMKREPARNPVSTVITAISMGLLAAIFGTVVYAFMPGPAPGNVVSSANVSTIDEQHRCPKCHALMEAGFVIDNTGEFAYPEQSKWGTGSPVRKYWGANPEIANAKAITSYRCTSCGYLEAYAK